MAERLEVLERPRHLLVGRDLDDLRVRRSGVAVDQERVAVLPAAHLRHPGQLFSRARLLDQLWPLEAEAGEETVKTHLNNLRRKLRLAGVPDPIETLHGQGYRLGPVR
ncbi:MAG: winged helix family transcriptional regulator [Planctomycetia bacterium]|nr:winged helix family transcriptional regulator [Planctomycetia bacterium]